MTDTAPDTVHGFYLDLATDTAYDLGPVELADDGTVDADALSTLLRARDLIDGDARSLSLEAQEAEGYFELLVWDVTGLATPLGRLRFPMGAGA